MNRARFLLVVSVAVAVVMVVAKPWGISAASRAAAAREMVPVFQFDPTWPKPLPKNWVIGSVVGVDVDHKDHIWIVHRPSSLSGSEKGAMSTPPQGECCAPAPPIVEFDQVGNYVQGWGGP